MIRRFLTVAGSIVLLSLVSASPSAAAPLAHAGHAPRTERAKSYCEPRGHAPSPKKVARQIRAIGGPLAATSRNLRGTIAARKSAIRHTHSRPQRPADESAIQNDTPAARTHVDLFLDLQPLGQFVLAFEQRPFTLAYSPRAPRGPPVAA